MQTLTPVRVTPPDGPAHVATIPLPIADRVALDDGTVVEPIHPSKAPPFTRDARLIAAIADRLEMRQEIVQVAPADLEPELASRVEPYDGPAAPEYVFSRDPKLRLQDVRTWVIRARADALRAYGLSITSTVEILDEEFSGATGAELIDIAEESHFAGYTPAGTEVEALRAEKRAEEQRKRREAEDQCVRRREEQQVIEWSPYGHAAIAVLLPTGSMINVDPALAWAKDAVTFETPDGIVVLCRADAEFRGVHFPDTHVVGTGWKLLASSHPFKHRRAEMKALVGGRLARLPDMARQALKMTRAKLIGQSAMTDEDTVTGKQLHAHLGLAAEMVRASAHEIVSPVFNLNGADVLGPLADRIVCGLRVHPVDAHPMMMRVLREETKARGLYVAFTLTIDEDGRRASSQEPAWRTTESNVAFALERAFAGGSRTVAIGELCSGAGEVPEGSDPWAVALAPVLQGKPVVTADELRAALASVGEITWTSAALRRLGQIASAFGFTKKIVRDEQGNPTHRVFEKTGANE